MITTVNDCKLLNLGTINDDRGKLTFVEGEINIPFQIERIYYLYDVPLGKSRGGHAHKEIAQLMIAISGSFAVKIDDGKSTKLITLSGPNYGLYIAKMIWRIISNFSMGSVCLVLASDHYDELDYIRNFTDFLRLKGVA